MATTTPNFGWSVPTSTDLVKDGATAIELLGDSIDAAFVDLKGGTTGQVLAKASNTDLDFTFVTVDDTNAIQNAIVDAKGDLIGATAADTPARLAVGANGTVLTADSAEATGLKWATPVIGSMTSIASGSLSGSSLSLTSISGSYKDLRLILRDYYTSAATTFDVTTNAVTSYSYSRIWTADTLGAALGTSSDTERTVIFAMEAATQAADNNNSFMFDLYDYTNTSSNKLFRLLNKYKSNAPVNKTVFNQGASNTTSAITSITITLNSGTFSGGTYILYGVN